MSRFLALADDPIAGGTKYDDVLAAAGVIPSPAATDILVVTTAQADPGDRDLDRNDDVRGFRANSAPVSFAATPSMTFEGRAWTSQLRKLLRKAMGGSVASTGTSPAAVQSTIQMAASGNLPALIGTLIREGQVDRMTGLWVNELTGNFPADAEGTMSGTLVGLYHDVDATGTVSGLPTPNGGPTQQTAYMLRDINAIMGDGVGIAIDCLAGFGFTINNNLTDDFRTRFCANKNLMEVTIDGTLHRIWYPYRNQLRAQTITGRLDFGDVRPDRELRRILRHAEKLVVELTADPLATTPPADEMIRLTFFKQAPTGGGAEPLVREGDQQSSYEFSAYLDPTSGKDLEAVVIGTAALT